MKGIASLKRAGLKAPVATVFRIGPLREQSEPWCRPVRYDEPALLDSRIACALARSSSDKSRPLPHELDNFIFDFDVAS